MTIRFLLSPSQLALRDDVADIAAAFADRAADHDRHGTFPRENFDDLAAAGLLALTVPADLGGRGEGFLGFQVAAEQMAVGDASTCLCFAMHCAGVDIALSGTPDQRAKWGAKVVEEHALFTVAFTEPGAGSNFLMPQTLARRVEGGYLLSGRKSFATSAGVADAIVVNAMVEDGKGPSGPSERETRGPSGPSERAMQEGFTLFVLEPSSCDGIQVEGDWDAMGMRANDSRSITLTDAFVPVDARIGDEGSGTAYTMAVPSFVPLGLATASVGIAQAALDMALFHATTRVIAPATKAIAEQQSIQFLVAEMAMAVNAMRLVATRAAIVAESEPEMANLAFTEAKAFCNSQGFDVANKGLQVVGGRGYVRGHQAERLVRDARAGDLMTPTAQQARESLGRALLGLNGSQPAEEDEPGRYGA